MGSGDLDALRAELKLAEADLAAIERQLEVARKNVDDKSNFGLEIDRLDLLEQESPLLERIDQLKHKISELEQQHDEKLPPRDLILGEPEPDADGGPPLQWEAKEPTVKVDDQPLLYEAPQFELGSTGAPSGAVFNVASADAGPAGTNMPDATAAKLQQAQAELAVVQGKIDAEQQALDEINKEAAEAAADPNADPDETPTGFGTTTHLDELRDQAAHLKVRIAELGGTGGPAKAAKPAEPAEPAQPVAPAGDIFSGLPPGDPAFAPTMAIPPVDVGPDAGAPPPLAWDQPNIKVVDEHMLYEAPEFYPESQPPVDAPAGIGFEVASTRGAPDDPPPANTRLRNAILAGGVIVLLAVGTGFVVVTSKPPLATALPTATATAPATAATPTPVLATPTTAPTLPPVVAGPIRYASECNGACFMAVDPATCDRTFHFVLALLGDAATAFEGKTAVISTVGPGLQPTYEVPVVNGKVVLDAVAKGAEYGGNPNAGCGANAHWTGYLTSVDGMPTITPDPPV